MLNRLPYFLIFLLVLTSCSRGGKTESCILTKNESKSLEYKLKTDKHLYVGYFDIYYLDSISYIHKLRISDIKQFYDLGVAQNYNELSDYIYAVFNQKLSMSDSITFKSMDLCCKLDSNIFELYKREHIKGIMSKYCKYDEKRKGYILFTCESQSEFDTISYLFFINRYFQRYSDKPYYIGFFPFEEYLHE